MAPIVHIVPHTHWDREWYHPASRFQVRLARVVDDAMSLLERGRLPVFLLDGQSLVPEHDLYRGIGPDGADVGMMRLPPQGYENGSNLAVDPPAARTRWATLRAVLERRARSPHWLVLNGADHHTPQPALRQAVHALEAL